MKTLAAAVAAAAVLLSPTAGNASVGGELRDPTMHDTVGCVAGIDDADIASLLCADHWYLSVTRMMYRESAGQRWEYAGGWFDIPSAGVVNQHLLYDPYGNPDLQWRVTFKVKDGDKANGRIDGRVSLPWVPPTSDG